MRSGLELKNIYVNYPLKDGTIEVCKVLYNNENGVEIIPINSIDKIKLGKSDSKIKDEQEVTQEEINAVPSNLVQPTNKNSECCTAEEFAKAKKSYNNAISNLNARAAEYMNTKLSDKARCVGSNPDAPNAEDNDYFTLSNSDPNDYKTLFSINNGTFRNTDTHYTTDWNQLELIDSKNVINTTKGETYWLASRNIEPQWYSGCNFNIRTANSGGGMVGTPLCRVYSGGAAMAYEPEVGFRPVFHLKSTVQVKQEEGRDGTTIEKAYNLQ